MAKTNIRNTPNETLNPRRFISAIKEHPEFQAGLPADSIDDLTDAEIRASRIAAVGNSATALAVEREKDHGAYDLDANLFSLIGSLHDFFEAQQAHDMFNDMYHNVKLKDINEDEKAAFRTDKRTILEFNNTLREVINAGASKFNFDELLEFITNQYAAITRENIPEFREEIRGTIIGMRNELAVEQILIQNGIEFELGTPETDAKGGDFIINGIPIDVKASEQKTARAKQKALRRGHNPDTIIWSHIEFRDYGGKLTLPQDAVDRISKELIPLINSVTRASSRRRAN